MKRVQCKACPWKKSTRPEVDIPGGYSEELHRGLSKTIVNADDFIARARAGMEELQRPLDVMACHESDPGSELVCVGWAVNQLGRGNNIQLRLQAMRDERFQDLCTVGPQHERFEDTLPGKE